MCGEIPDYCYRSTLVNRVNDTGSAMRTDTEMDFAVANYRHFIVEHCCDCLVSGYLIVSPVIPVLSLAGLSREAQEALGPVLAAAAETVQTVIAPIKIYCAQFGEEGQHLHFHVFPRSAEITTEYLRAFPEQRDLIHGPLLLDWARSRYRVPKSEVWRAVAPAIERWRAEFHRIAGRATEQVEARRR